MSTQKNILQKMGAESTKTFIWKALPGDVYDKNIHPNK